MTEPHGGFHGYRRQNRPQACPPNGQELTVGLVPTASLLCHRCKRMNDPLAIAVATAMREAAEGAIMPRYSPGTAIHADYKAVGEAVTAADHECEAILTARLAGLIPGAGVVGEEAAARDPALLDQIGQGTCWIIDPLDGTGNFARGRTAFRHPRGAG